jgi:DNA-binding beta-propeller fold protein YncE
MRRFFAQVARTTALAVAILTCGCPAPSTPTENPPPPPPGPHNPADDPMEEEDALRVALFVLGPNTGFVGFDGAHHLHGVNLGVTTELMAGPNTVIQPRDAALDSRGALYIISGAKSGSVAIYENPLSANGGRLPDRMVFGDATQIANNPSGIAIDLENETLYVASITGDLLAFSIGVPEAFNGAVAPARTFRVNMPLFKAEQLRFANGSLYVVDARGGTSDIMAFDNPSSLVGDVLPDRVISHAGFDNTIGIDVDAFDRLWVGVRDLGQVLMFEGAGSLDGAVEPDLALSIADATIPPKPSFATTDSEDRLYVADSNGNVIFVFDVASELLSGARRPARTIDSAELVAPNRLLVFERY